MLFQYPLPNGLSDVVDLKHILMTGLTVPEPDGFGSIDLRQEFFNHYNNPVRLSYSLNWGADTFLRHPLPRKAGN
jgi:hypothetical protein